MRPFRRKPRSDRWDVANLAFGLLAIGLLLVLLLLLLSFELWAPRSFLG
jgi:hypothetical protein